MDEKQRKYQFMTVLSESHPGLTFEEYRDSCIFLLFYHYLCLRFDEEMEENYKLHMMVRMAVRGKLQMDSFLRFIENASAYLYALCPEFNLTDFSFYKSLLEVETQEKQKSYARFIRKLIKKMDSWGVEEDLLQLYPACFEALMIEFSNMKKETGIPENILALYDMFCEKDHAEKSRKVFQPEFRYGSLLRRLLSDCQDPFYCGYEISEDYIELMRILCYLHGISPDNYYFSNPKEWIRQKRFLGQMDTVCVYKPEGVEAGSFLSAGEENASIKSLLQTKTKGELPFLLSAFPLLREDGDVIAIMPSSLLYREGRENQIRRYLVDDLNCLDTVLLLPDSIFPSIGQQEVFLYLKKNRDHEEVMFFDCSSLESFDENTLKEIRKSWKGRKSVSGFCRCADREEISKNDYNLNLPRYIKKPMGIEIIDIDTKRKRIEEIGRELKEINERIEMYRRDLELDAMI